jgi:hypothetical protein
MYNKYNVNQYIYIYNLVYIIDDIDNPSTIIHISLVVHIVVM